MKWSFIIFLFLPAMTMHAQDRSIDSLQDILKNHREDSNAVNALVSLSDAYLKKGDGKKSLRYANEALDLSRKILFKKGEGDAFISLAYIYYNNHNYPEAIKAAGAALQIFQEKGFKSGILEVYQVMGATYTNDEDFPEAIKVFYAALEIYEDLGNKERMAECLNWIGFNYYWQENYQQSFNVQSRALKIYKEIGKEKSEGGAFCYIYMANVYRVQQQYREALLYDSIGLKISLDGGYVQLAANAYTSKGDILSANQGFPDSLSLKEALTNYLLSLESFRAAGDPGGMGDSYNHISRTNLLLGRVGDAQLYADSCLLIATEVHSLDNLKKTYSVQARIDSLKGNYRLAYEHYKLFIIYRDSLLNDVNTKKSLQAQSQYDNNKKEAEAQRNKNRQYLIMGLLAIFVLAGIVVALIQYRNNKQKQKANLLLERQKQKVEATLQELKSTQAQLIQSEKMASLGELTAGIAHEIQNPLNFVNNFSEINNELIDELKNQKEKLEIGEQNALLDDISQNNEKITFHGKRADAIVKGMLEHSRQGTGQTQLTDINALADEYLKLAFHGMQTKDKNFNATLNTGFDTTIGQINIIPQDIGRVLLNIYNNAFYAVSEKQKQVAAAQRLSTSEKLTTLYKPVVEVNTWKENGKVLILVKDNGPGIPNAVIDKVFQPFFTTKPTGQGTGLGLSLAYDIVKAHGGELKVESSERNGTEFTITLPAPGQGKTGPI